MGKETKAMSTTNETRPQDPNKTPWYKSAVLPWFIVAIFVAASIGLISGWFLRSNVAYEKDQAVAAVVSKQQGR